MVTIPGLSCKLFQIYQYDVPIQYYTAQYLEAEVLFKKLLHKYDGKGCKASLYSLFNGINTIIWGKTLSTELKQIIQGTVDIKGNDLVNFISKSDVPKDHIIICTDCCVWLTVSGDKLDYNLYVASPTVLLLETQLFINSAFYDAYKRARF